MTVAELVKMLKAFEPDRVVVLQKDAEGNGYSPLIEAYPGMYRAETTWYGDVGLEALDDGLRERGFTEEDVMHDGERALVLVPVN